MYLAFKVFEMDKSLKLMDNLTIHRGGLVDREMLNYADVLRRCTIL